ncbi:hypothetical protein OROMI_001765 [Orobanche minor]
MSLAISRNSKIRDGTLLEAEEILTYIKSPQNGLVWHFYSKLDVPSNVVQKKRVVRILFFKIRPSQEILKIRDGTPLETEEIFTYIKKPSKHIGLALSSNLDVPSNVVQKKRVVRILFFKIRPSQEILKIRDDTPLEAEEIMTNIKKPSKQIVVRILFFKIRPSQEILKIRDGTPLVTEEILTYIKSPQNISVWHFSSKLDVPGNAVQKKRVVWILFFKIRPSQEILKFVMMPSQEILKIRDGTPLEAEEKIDVPSNVVQKKRVVRILFFKIRPSQEILKIRDGTPLETEEILTYIKKPSKHIEKSGADSAFKIRSSQEILKIHDVTPLVTEEILTYIKSPQNISIWHFSSKLDVPSNVVQKKRVVRILFFKIRSSQEILKIHVPGNAVQKKRVVRILFFKIRPSQEILEIRDDIPSNVVQKKRVAQILFLKIRPSQEILKICDGTPLETEEMLIYIKKPSRKIGLALFSSKLDVPSKVVQKKRVARILFFKIRPSQEILKIRDGTPLEAEEILTYIKSPQNGSIWHFSSKLDVPSNIVHKKRVVRILFFKIRPSQDILKIRDDVPSKVVQKKRVARILFFKIRPFQEILKIRDGTPLEAEEILTYIKSPQNGSVWHFSSKLDVPSNVVEKKRVVRILFLKIRPSQEILKIRDGIPLCHLDVPSNVVQKKRVVRILFFKIRPSQEILKICDDVPSKVVQKKRVARILFLKIRPSQEILKIRDGTPLEAEEILTYKKSPQNGSIWHFSSKLDVPSNVVQKKRVVRILFLKIRPSQEILKIRDGIPLKRVVRIMFFKIRPSQEILEIRDGTPLETEEILTYIKSPKNKSVWHFSSNLDVPSNVVQKKRMARILFFKIRPSQEILKFVMKKRVVRILFFKIRPSQEIRKICDGTPLETEEMLIYIKKPSRKIGLALFSSKLDVPSKVVQKKRVARILFFKIRPSQEILKIRDGTPLEAEEILTYIKSPQNGSIWHFSSKLDVPSNVVHKKRVVRILFFKIRPSQDILKIRDGTPLETEEILTYIKKP